MTLSSTEKQELLDLISRFLETTNTSIKTLSMDLKDVTTLLNQLPLLSKEKLKEKNLTKKDVKRALKEVEEQKIQLEFHLETAKKTLVGFEKFNK